jgi:hypothetical protein
MRQGFASGRAIQQAFGLRIGRAILFHAKDTKILKRAAQPLNLKDANAQMIFRFELRS